MALRELPSNLFRLVGRDVRPATTTILRNCRRYASGEASSAKDALEDLQDLESQSTFSSSEFELEKIKAYDPVKRAQGRKKELPSSRYDSNCD
jgi:large subunit ribosomal protein L5